MSIFSVSFPVMTSSGQRLTVLSKSIMGLSTPVPVNKVIGGVVTTTAGASVKPVMRVPPLQVSTSQPAGPVVQQQTQIRCAVARSTPKDSEKNQVKETPKSEFYLVS